MSNHGWDIGDDLESERHGMDEASGVPLALDELLDRVEAFVRSYVRVTEEQGCVLALFVAHTYAVEASDTTPYLEVTSPERRSGKTRLLEVLELLVREPLRASNVSDAAVYRSLAAKPTTLLMDESDAVFDVKGNRQELRGLLNGGFRRGSPAIRMVGEGSKMRPVPFDVYGPKVLAGIGRLPDTIADRAFPIRLKRKTAGEHVARFRFREARSLAEPIRVALEAWNADEAYALDEIRPELPTALDDRGQDAAEPLLAIADLAGGDWPTRGRRSLVVLRAQQADTGDDTLGVRLLADTFAVFERAEAERLSSESIVKALCADEEAPWSDLRGKPLTARGLARLLRPFEVRSLTVRLPDGTTPKGYKREDFVDAWTRYLPPSGDLSATTDTTAPLSQKQAISIRHNTPDVADTKQASNPDEYSDVAVVAVENAQGAVGTVEEDEIERLATVARGAGDRQLDLEALEAPTRPLSPLDEEL